MFQRRIKSLNYIGINLNNVNFNKVALGLRAVSSRITPIK